MKNRDLTTLAVAAGILYLITKGEAAPPQPPSGEVDAEITQFTLTKQ